MKGGRWTQDEVAELRRRFPIQTLESIARDLGRGRAGVADKAHRLGLRKSNKRPWTQHELDELRRRYPDDPAADIARDLGRSVPMVYCHARKLGLCKSAAFLKRMADRARPWEDWSAEDIEILRRRYPHERTADLAKDLRRTVSGVYGMAKNLGLHKTDEFNRSPLAGGIQPGERRGRKYEFKKGNVPWSKGTKGLAGVHQNCRKTQFKRGHKRNDEIPLGGMRLETKQRVWLVKVKMDGPPKLRWYPLARIVWERERGPIPKGYVVRINGWDTKGPEPPEAVTIDRLECLSMAENLRRNSIYRFPEPIVQAIKARGYLSRAINKVTGKKRNGKARRRQQRQHNLGSPGSSVRDD